MPLCFVSNKSKTYINDYIRD
uniref:Calcineurin B-like protein 2 isoform X1 n=1 Tax=Rhizophora mucronata TaxID=61149 RepID=A0A2P2M1A0_RHIMU